MKPLITNTVMGWVMAAKVAGLDFGMVVKPSGEVTEYLQ